MIGYLMDGGWMMIPLLICSIAMVAAIIDRARAFRCAAKIDPDKMRAEVCEAVAAGDVDRAVKVCEEGEGPVAAVLLTGCATAFVVSVVAIRTFIGYIKDHSFTAFGWYRILLGALVALYFLIR